MAADRASIVRSRGSVSGRVRRRGGWPLSRLPAPQQRELILALLLVLCYGFFQRGPGWNENSRYDLILALVNDRTVSIDAYHQNTGDKSFYDGHYYSNKAPGAALLGAPIYALMRARAALAGREPPDHRSVMHGLAFAIAGVPTVLLALLLLRFLRPLVGEGWALAVTLGHALGTIAFPFATMFFGHAASALFLFAAFYMLWRWREDGRWWRPVVAGGLAGWAVLVEYPTALGVGLLLVYAFWTSRRGGLLFLAGGLPPLFILLGYHWIAFGHPLTPANHYSIVPGAVNRRGVLGVDWPKPSVLLDLLVAPRGLLVLSPWLGLAPLGFWAARRSTIRGEAALCAAIVAAFLLFNAGFWAPFGGWAPGPRFLVPALPFAAALVGFVPPYMRLRIVPLIAYALVPAIMATATAPHVSENVGEPIPDVWLPRLLAGELVRTTAGVRLGLQGAEPLGVLGLAVLMASLALYATTRPTPAGRRLAGVGAGLLAGLVVWLGTPVDLSRDIILAPSAAAGGIALMP